MPPGLPPRCRTQRFLQVLDVDIEDDTAYVVREWMSGRDLTVLLAGGPLSPDQAGAVAREVAEALAAAHRDGLTHLLLRPGSVLITPDGGVKVAGLATEAAVHGATARDPGVIDAAGVGSVLYAALTGRWPDGGGPGPARGPDDRWPCGVPATGPSRSPPARRDRRRTLGNAARHHATPLRSPAEVVDALVGVTTGQVNGLSAGSTTRHRQRPASCRARLARHPVGVHGSRPVRAPARRADEPRSGTARAHRGCTGRRTPSSSAPRSWAWTCCSVPSTVAVTTTEPRRCPPPPRQDSTTAQPAPEPTPLAISAAVDPDPPPGEQGREPRGHGARDRR